MQSHDHIRKLLIHEPRGHADMYGCYLVEPERPEADFGIVFMHNEGYSTMCGHGTIAITKLAYILQWKQNNKEVFTLELDVPCGSIKSFIDQDADQEFAVRFQGVPSFVLRDNLTIEVRKYGDILFDIAYGGAFYAYVDADRLGLSLASKNIGGIIEAGKEIKAAIIGAGIPVLHPIEKDLSFLYGVIFRSKITETSANYRNVCVFADGEVDRSPTGSGLCGFLALLRHKKMLGVGDHLIVESVISSRFEGQILNDRNFFGYQAVDPLVGGNAYVVGDQFFYLDPEDPIREGFFLR